MKQESRLILAVDDFTDALADALYEAGFDDAHLTKSGGRPCIVVDDRDTTDLETTVRQAIADANRAGVRVLRVEVPAVEHINAERIKLQALSADEAQTAVDEILHPLLWQKPAPEELAWPGDLADDAEDD